MCLRDQFSFLCRYNRWLVRDVLEHRLLNNMPLFQENLLKIWFDRVVGESN